MLRHLRQSLQHLWQSVCAPWRGLRALVQLPWLLMQWHAILQEHTAVVRETNDLFRELLIGIGHGPSQTPETPRLVSSLRSSSNQSSGLPAQDEPSQPSQPPLQSVPLSEPQNPKRLRTARDVTYSSRQFLREQDARVEAAQAPWRTPGA